MRRNKSIRYTVQVEVRIIPYGVGILICVGLHHAALDVSEKVIMQKKTYGCTIIHHDIVLEAKNTMLSPEELKAISGVFKILGDPTRAKLVWALNHREMCVCDLAATLEMTKSAISHQLKKLRIHGVVKSYRKGKNIFYTLDDQHITDIVDLAKIHTGHAHCDED